MRGKSLLLYILIILLNLFLLLPVFFTYALLAPLHILIYWLSFKTVIKSKGFKSTMDPVIFSIIPLIIQIVVIIIFLFIGSGATERVISVLLDNQIFLTIYISIDLIEFLILLWVYSRCNFNKNFN